MKVKMPVSSLLALAVSITSAQGQSTSQRSFALHSDDRVVFYGDSITDNSNYCRDVEDFIATRFPDLEVRYFNAGVGGDRVTGGWMGPVDLRLTRDLFPRKPTVITIMLGMNDASYKAFDQPTLDTYENGYRHIMDRIRTEAPGARVFLFRPSPYDEVTRPPVYPPDGYNGVLLRYADFVSDLAKQTGSSVVDQNAPLNDVVRKIDATDHASAQEVIHDRIHPGWQGDYIMAEQILKAWNAPSLVSDVFIDAAAGTATAKNATVSGVQKSPNLSWTSKEGCLPFYIYRKDKLMNLVVANSDLDQALNQETLTVSGLASGSFDLRIDGKSAGSFTADQLAKGVNLASDDATPMFEQAEQVRNLIDKRAELSFQKWRLIEFNLQDMPSARVESAKRALDALDQELLSRERLMAKTKAHRFELVPGS
jgi:lysophospholipase L1-like esterase